MKKTSLTFLSSLNYYPRLESVHFYLDGFRENYGPWKNPKNWVNCPGAAWSASPECDQGDFLGWGWARVTSDIGPGWGRQTHISSITLSSQFWREESRSWGETDNLAGRDDLGKLLSWSWLEILCIQIPDEALGVRLTISLIFTTIAVSSCESDKETSAIKPIIYGAYIHHTQLNLKSTACPPKLGIVSYDNKYFIYDPRHVII